MIKVEVKEMLGKVLNDLLNGSLVRKKVKKVYVDGDDLLHIIAKDEDGLTYDIYFNLNNPAGGVNVVVTDKGKVVSMWHYVVSTWHYGDNVKYVGLKWKW